MTWCVAHIGLRHEKFCLVYNIGLHSIKSLLCSVSIDLIGLRAIIYRCNCKWLPPAAIDGSIYRNRCNVSYRQTWICRHEGYVDLVIFLWRSILYLGTAIPGSWDPEFKPFLPIPNPKIDVAPQSRDFKITKIRWNCIFRVLNDASNNSRL